LPVDNRININESINLEHFINQSKKVYNKKMGPRVEQSSIEREVDDKGTNRNSVALANKRLSEAIVSQTKNKSNLNVFSVYHFERFFLFSYYSPSLIVSAGRYSRLACEDIHSVD
jgi:hypothetical protein